MVRISRDSINIFIDNYTRPLYLPFIFIVPLKMFIDQKIVKLKLGG